MDSTFYVRNRQRLLECLEENSLVFLYSGLAPVKSNDQYMHPFSVNRNFYYLTGIDTQGVWLVLAKTAGAIAEYLFIDQPDEEIIRWYGKMLTQEEACAEIQDTSRKITEITGQPVEYVRPPFGNWNRELECEVMMIPIFWSVDTLDWSTRNADRLVDQVVSEAEENDIILMHDCYDSTVKAALRIVDLLQAEGYEFVTADELILE